MSTTGPFYSDGSPLDNGTAGIAVGDTRILSSVSGEQELYRVEMYRLSLISHLSVPTQMAKLDNQAVTKVASIEPLNIPLATTMRQKHLQAEWIKGHGSEGGPKDKEDRQDIR